MSPTCPECGASLPQEDTCQTIFEQFLSLEFTDAAYGAVHFLTVACFMIQHGRYSDAALAWLQPVIRAYLEDSLTTEQIRHRAANNTGSDTRPWKVNRPKDAPPLPKIAWSMTIVDVAEQFSDAQSYCDLVKLWAQVTLRELTSIPNR